MAARMSDSSPQMRAAVDAEDWRNTPLGPADAWPRALRAGLDLILSMPQPAGVCWGPQARLFYNDLYRPILADRHPAALGAPLAEVWSDLAESMQAPIDAVMAGEAQVWDDAAIAILGASGARQLGWFTATWTPLHADDASVGGFLIVATETTSRRQAEAALRQSQDRQAFLLGLADLMRPLGNAGDIQLAAARALAQRLGAARVGYAEDLGDGEIAVTRNYVRGAPCIEGRYRYEDYGADLLPAFRQGRTVVRGDVANDPNLSAAEKAAHAALQIGATVNVPLVKDGTLRAVLFVHFEAAHRIDPREVELMREVAERTWAEVMRARVEEELRHSEERYRTLFTSMDEGYCIIQMLYDPDGVANDWRFIEVNRAFERHNGLQEATGRTIREMAPDIEQAWIDIYNHVAETGESRRFQQPSGALEGRIFDLYAFRVGAPDERKVAVLFSDITEGKRLAERQAVLLAELQHRVRNTMAMIRTISERTLSNAGSLEAFGAAWRGRLATLSQVQALLTRSANAGIELSAIVCQELEAQAADESQYRISGEPLMLPPKAAEVLTLAVHELATNALKYGALSRSDGRIDVAWALAPRDEQPWVSFSWREQAPGLAPAPPRRRGFGRELIERRVPYDLHGHSQFDLDQTGVTCVLEFPLIHRASVLETGVPDRDAVFKPRSSDGGLRGLRVLLLEDDFLLAVDAAQALENAGATVVGPFSTEEAGLEALEQNPPEVALVDINLGQGPSFRMARALVAKGVPFAFLTGYDEIVLPEELSQTTRLKKPMEMRQVVDALETMRRLRGVGGSST
jgi:two-component sensor histidine kinase/CheY-like chemotaxis protein